MTYRAPSLFRPWLRFTAAFFVAGVSMDASDFDLRKLAAQVRPAVVSVETFDAYDRPLASGTAFYIGERVGFVTNRHVIARPECSRIQIKAHDGSTVNVARVLARTEPDTPDFALLMIENSAWANEHVGAPLEFAKGHAAQAGERIAVVGSPLGLEGTLSEGIVSAVREENGIPILLQISAPISPGSSGSPVVNEHGKVLGVATYTLRGGQALNFAVPWHAYDALQNSVPWLSPDDFWRKSITGGSPGILFQNFTRGLMLSSRARLAACTRIEAILNSGQSPEESEKQKIHREEYAEAIAHYRALKARCPSDAATYRELGSMLREQGDFAEASLEYQAALELYRYDHETLRALGELMTETNKSEKARDYFRRALVSAAPVYARLRDDYDRGSMELFLGDCEDALGNRSRARELYLSASERGRGWRGWGGLKDEALEKLGRIHAIEGRENDALKAFLAISAPNERHARARAYMKLSVACGEAGRKDRARYWGAQFFKIREALSDPNPRAQNEKVNQDHGGLESETGERRYKVSDLPAGDSLNVRAGPGMSFETIGRLPNGSRGIQTLGSPVMNEKTEWVKISSGTGTGWVRSKYLRRQ